MDEQPEVMAREMWATKYGVTEFQKGKSVRVYPMSQDLSHRILVQTLPADAPPFPEEFSRPGVRVRMPSGKTVTTGPAYFNGSLWRVPTRIGIRAVDPLAVIPPTPPTPPDPIERMRDEHPDEAVRSLAAEVLRLRKEVGR